MARNAKLAGVVVYGEVKIQGCWSIRQCGQVACADAFRPALLAEISQLDQELVRLMQKRATLVLEASRQNPSPAHALLPAPHDEQSLKRLTAVERRTIAAS